MLGQTVSMSEIGAPGQEKGAISVSGRGGEPNKNIAPTGDCAIFLLFSALTFSHTTMEEMAHSFL
jgi:hypothetical protein